jgi:hypothetical protein
MLPSAPSRPVPGREAHTDLLCIRIADREWTGAHPLCRGRAGLSPATRRRGCQIPQATGAGDGQMRWELPLGHAPTSAKGAGRGTDARGGRANGRSSCTVGTPGVGTVGSHAQRGARANPLRAAAAEPEAPPGEGRAGAGVHFVETRAPKGEEARCKRPRPGRTPGKSSPRYGGSSAPRFWSARRC